jgi:hypothetical protein
VAVVVPRVELQELAEQAAVEVERPVLTLTVELVLQTLAAVAVAAV